MLRLKKREEPQSVEVSLDETNWEIHLVVDGYAVLSIDKESHQITRIGFVGRSTGLCLDDHERVVIE